MSRELVAELRRFAAAHANAGLKIRARSFEDFLLKGTHEGKQGAYNFAEEMLAGAMEEMDGENINQDQYIDILQRLERQRAKAEVNAQNAVTVTTFDTLRRGQHIGRRDAYAEIIKTIQDHKYTT